MNLISSKPFKGREDDMSNLAAGFVVWMRKWATSAQGKTTPNSEVLSSKRLKLSDPDEVAQKS